MERESTLLRLLADYCGVSVNLDNTERRDERRRLASICEGAHRLIAPLIAAQNEAVSFEDSRKMRLPATELRIISAAFIGAGDKETEQMLMGIKHYGRVIHDTDETFRRLLALADRAEALGVPADDVADAMTEIFANALVAE